MKLHYAGKYNLNPESRPHGEHRPGAVPFKELQNPRDFAVFINAGCLAVTALLMALAFWRSGGFYRAPLQFFLGVVTALFSLLPHELLHGLCFRGASTFTPASARGCSSWWGRRRCQRPGLCSCRCCPTWFSPSSPSWPGCSSPGSSISSS